VEHRRCESCERFQTGISSLAITAESATSIVAIVASIIALVASMAALRTEPARVDFAYEFVAKEALLRIQAKHSGEEPSVVILHNLVVGMKLGAGTCAPNEGNAMDYVDDVMNHQQNICLRLERSLSLNVDHRSDSVGLRTADLNSDATLVKAVDDLINEDNAACWISYTMGAQHSAKDLFLQIENPQNCAVIAGVAQ
jgi:hypothetical protein